MSSVFIIRKNQKENEEKKEMGKKCKIIKNLERIKKNVKENKGK